MNRIHHWLTPGRLKMAFYATLLAILGLSGYRIYLAVHEQNYRALHAEQIEQIQRDTGNGERMHFIVVGNINNSIGLFERKMLPMINAEEPTFVASAGNAVSGGGEDKYRALYRTLGLLDAPYVLTVGENESSILGSFNFYDHFGPYFYDFRAGDSQFLFLDSSDPDTYPFQLHWLRERLQESNATHRFVFLGHPMFRSGQNIPLDFSDDHHLDDTDFRDQLHELFKEHSVEAVFSSNLPLFSRQERDGVTYIITGGAGGLILNNETSFYHYVDVMVDGDGVHIEPKRLDIGQHQIWRTLESLWFFIHSLFYVGHINFLLILGLLLLTAIKLYSVVFMERDYYRNYDIDHDPYRTSPLRVAMVTNNYLPFVGGVPIAIERLRRGLERLGHSVLVLAPRYPGQDSDAGVVRLPTLFSLGRQSEFRLANPLSPRFGRALRDFQPDLIHIHHPFWLGWSALLFARHRKLPTVLTYHTRLEHYSHFVPLPGPLFRNLIAHTAIRRFANRCTAVIVPTESAEEYLRLIGVTSMIVVHPTGIEYDRFQKVDTDAVAKLRRHHAINPDELILISVSRLSREKNIDFLIDGMRQLVQKGARQPFRLLLLGDGQERNHLQERINELGLEATITLVGSVPQTSIPTYYQMADIFVFASRSETQGMVILEAMAAGLPVVAVRSSGIDDIIEEGGNGFKTAADIDSWTTALDTLMASRERRLDMGEQARTFARDYAIEPFASQVVETYAHILALHNWQPRTDS